jgi:hypothetical protein
MGEVMMNFKTGDGTFRGLFLGTALAALMILAVNLLGVWEQAHRPNWIQAVRCHMFRSC